MYGIRSKLVSLPAQASMFVQAKTLNSYEICLFPVNYKSVKSFVEQAPGANVIKLFTAVSYDFSY
jgi:hypothetical protein